MNIVLRAAFGYLFLLFAMRLIGRRTASMMAPFDLVVLFMIGGTVITAILGDDRSMTATASAIFAIGLMHVLVSELKRRSPTFGRLVDGTPVIVYEKGEWHADRMRTLRLLEQDVMTAVRQRGLMRLEQVRYAVVERDGKISVIEQSDD